MTDPTEPATIDLREHYHRPPSIPKVHTHHGRTPAKQRTVNAWTVECYNLITTTSKGTVTACGCSHLNITAPDGTAARLIGPAMRGHRSAYPSARQQGLSAPTRDWGLFANPTMGNVPPENAPLDIARLMAIHALVTGREGCVRGWTARPDSLAHLIDWFHPALASNYADAVRWQAYGATADDINAWLDTGAGHDHIARWSPWFTPFDGPQWSAHFTDPVVAYRYSRYAGHFTRPTLADLRRRGVTPEALDALLDDEDLRAAYRDRPDRDALDARYATPDLRTGAKSVRASAVLLRLARPDLGAATALGLVALNVTPTDISDLAVTAQTLTVMAGLT